MSGDSVAASPSRSRPSIATASSATSSTPARSMTAPAGAGATMNGHFASVAESKNVASGAAEDEKERYEHGIQVIDEDKEFKYVFGPPFILHQELGGETPGWCWCIESCEIESKRGWLKTGQNIANVALVLISIATSSSRMSLRLVSITISSPSLDPSRLENLPC